MKQNSVCTDERQSSSFYSYSRYYLYYLILFYQSFIIKQKQLQKFMSMYWPITVVPRLNIKVILCGDCRYGKY